MRISHHYFGSHWAKTSLVEDGRLTSPTETGWQVQVLSPAGVERIRDEIVETGLFEESADLTLVPVPDQGYACGDGLGLTFAATIELPTDAGLITVTWGRTNAPEGCYEDSPASEALDALLGRLESLDGWLPTEAWEYRMPRPLQPHGFRLITIAQPWHESFGNRPDAGTVDWPLAGTLLSHGDSLPPLLVARDWIVRCGPVTADEANQVVDAIRAAGGRFSDSIPNGFASATLLSDGPNESTVAVILEAMRPDQTDCEGLNLGFVNCWQVIGVQPFYCAMP
jgi:hypothetical protein